MCSAPYTSRMFRFSIHLKDASMCLFLLVMLAIRTTVFDSQMLLIVFLADTINLFYNHNSSVIQVPLLKTGNSWWTDKNVKFRNPESYNLSSAFAGKNGSAGGPYFSMTSLSPPSRVSHSEKNHLWEKYLPKQVEEAGFRG